MGCKHQAVGQSCGHDQPVGRIAMELFRQLLDRDAHLHIERQKLNNTWVSGLPQPVLNGQSRASRPFAWSICASQRLMAEGRVQPTDAFSILVTSKYPPSGTLSEATDFANSF
jgi:hypothetical protein